MDNTNYSKKPYLGVGNNKKTPSKIVKQQLNISTPLNSLGNFSRQSQRQFCMSETNFRDFHNPWILQNFFGEDKQNVVEWFQKNNLLSREYLCTKCNSLCDLHKRKRSLDGCTFRCDNGMHEYSVRAHSFFKNFRYSLADIVLFIINLLDGFTLVQNARKIGMSYSNAAPRWAKLVRLIMAERIWQEYFCNNSDAYKMKDFVQCDESRFGRKVKANSGCPHGRCVWLAGLIETETGRLLLLPVKNR